MADTLSRIRPLETSNGKGLRLDPSKRRRRPVLAIASLALVAVCVAAFASAYLQAGHQVSVLAVAQPVSQGETISASDLKIVKVSLSSGIATIPADAAETVLGRRAATSLVPGSLLAPGEIVGTGDPPPGEAIVGVALKPGQLPAAGVSPGQTVDVVMTGPPDAQDTATSTAAPSAGQSAAGPASGPGTILAPDVLVTAIAQPATTAGTDTVVVSLMVPRVFAPLVASASAAGQAAIAIISSGS